MANLNAIFESNGLQGVIPYAFGMKGQGYNFLCQKILEGTPFWMITSHDTGMPYFFADENRVMFGLFSTQERASCKCDELARDNFITIPVFIESGGWTAQLIKRYRDLGVTHLVLDDSALVKIEDLVPSATYDGMLNLHTPLRNARLNSALYCFAQFSAAGIENNALVAYFWQIIKDSHLYAPRRPLRTLNPGESFTELNSDFHYVTLDDGLQAVLCFTDMEFLNIYADAAELMPEEYLVSATPGYSDWSKFLRDRPGMAMILNIGAGDFLFTEEIIRGYELALLKQRAQDANGIATYF